MGSQTEFIEIHPRPDRGLTQQNELTWLGDLILANQRIGREISLKSVWEFLYLNIESFQPRVGGSIQFNQRETTLNLT